MRLSWNSLDFLQCTSWLSGSFQIHIALYLAYSLSERGCHFVMFWIFGLFRALEELKQTGWFDTERLSCKGLQEFEGRSFHSALKLSLLQWKWKEFRLKHPSSFKSADVFLWEVAKVRIKVFIQVIVYNSLNTSWNHVLLDRADDNAFLCLSIYLSI